MLVKNKIERRDKQKYFHLDSHNMPHNSYMLTVSRLFIFLRNHKNAGISVPLIRIIKEYSWNLFSVYLLCIVGICAQFLFCVIPAGIAPSELSMHIDGTDSIAPFGTVTVNFDKQITDSLVVMRLIPDHIFLTAIINPDRMSALFVFPEPLRGNTRYHLIPQGTISSGSAMLDGSDSLTFVSYFKEMEPNNSKETADIWEPKMFGMISTVDDTDWYVIANSHVKSVYRLEYGSRCTFSVVDSIGKIIAGNSSMIVDTLVIPQAVTIPLYVVVNSYLRSAGGYYEIGVIYK